jgi:ABC-type glycerol-3-phosphate transport system substrate-binding protein
MKIWLLSDYDHRKHLAFKSMLGRFSAAFPEAGAEFAVKSRRTMWESLFAHLRDPKRNPLADIIEIPQNWTELFSRLGLFADLAPKVEPLSARRYPDFIFKELLRHDDARAFSAPWWLEAPALFFRPRVLEGVCRAPWTELATWEGFRAALDRLPAGGKNRNLRALAAPYSSGAVCAADVLPRVWGRRGGLFSDDFNRATFTREETAGGIEDWLELAISGKIELFSPDRFENGPLPAEQCAFIISSRKLPGQSPRRPGPGPRPARAGQRSAGARQAPRAAGPGELKMLPYPGCSAGGGLALVYNLAVSASSSDPSGAAAFVSWAMKPENLGPFTESFGVFPCLKTIFEECLQQDSEAETYRKMFSAPELMPNIMAYPTAELLLERALWNLSLKIARRDYDREDLTRELIMAQGEADYLLSLY